MKEIVFDEIKAIRDIIGASQKDFAHMLDISKQTLSRYEKTGKLPICFAYRYYVELRNIIENAEDYMLNEHKIKILKSFEIELLYIINKSREEDGFFPITIEDEIFLNTYLTLEELKHMRENEDVYVRTTVIYSHLVRIQDNHEKIEEKKILRKAICNAQDKNHVDSVFAKMSVGEVLFIFEKYYEDYNNFVVK